MGYGGYCSDTVVATARRRRQRRRRESCQSFTCISPWFIFCRWFNGGKTRGSKNRFMDRKNQMVKGSRNHESSSPSPQDVSEIGRGTSFNLGVGFGLIYLVAASRNELNKMVELQKKMELLLQNFQTEFQNQEKKQLFVPAKSSISSSFSNTGAQETLYAEEQDSGQYLYTHDVKRPPEIGFNSDRYRGEKSWRMDQLEAELEAEFNSLQLHMDAESFFKHSNEQCSEINVEDSAPEWSLNTCFEEVGEQQEMSNDEYYGVPPRELERKLHELLEQRQQERIDELESALDYAMQQLEEKERELSWWKDTARLVSQHLPAIPSLLQQAKQALHGMEPEIEVGKLTKA